LKLYTVQHESVLTQILAGKNYYGTTNHIYSGWLSAYDWMKTQMEKRLGIKFPDDCYPIWFCNSIEACEIELDCEGISPYFLMEFEIDSSLLVSSDFQKWNSVLMNCYVIEDYYGSALIPISTDEYSDDPVEIRNSWVRVFDISKTSSSDVQVTTPFVTRAQLVSWISISEL
jgi:hypothetical protein